MASVTYEHVYKRYPGNVVITDMNADIKDKEFVVLVGPSGSGKSTALRMLAGLEEISDGTVKIGDRPVNDVAPKDRDIAMVFQSYALYPHMSVYDNLSFGLKLRKTPKDEIDRRVREAAQILGLEPFLDRKPKALSGGERQAALTAEGFNVPVAERVLAEAGTKRGEEVVMGIRPEDLKDARFPGRDDLPRIRAKVDVVENMGSENFVYFTIGGKAFTARMDPRSSDIQPGQSIA